ncbi:MAG: hypothetical protein ACYS1A_20335 [Planctomycetota bacterium]
MSQRRLENAILHAFGLIIPKQIENASQAAREGAESALWRQEQEYSRRYGLHNSMTIVSWSTFHDSRKFPRQHYRLESRCLTRP